MKIKSIIKTTKCIYAVSDDVDTIFNKMNEPYFFADTLFSKGEKSDLPRFSGALADAESNFFIKIMTESLHILLDICKLSLIRRKSRQYTLWTEIFQE